MTSDKRIEALKDERRQLISAKQDLERRIDELCQENERLRQELAIRESSEQEKVIDYLGKECVDWEDKYLALAGENAKLRKMNEAMWLIIRCAIGEVSARDGLPVIHEDDLTMLRNMRRDLRNEVDE